MRFAPLPGTPAPGAHSQAGLSEAVLSLNLEGAAWRVETAPRAAIFIDMADYFSAAKAAMRKARRSIHFLNWAFEPKTRFHPDPAGGEARDDQIGEFLKQLARNDPGLDIRILCWQSALPVAATQGFFPLQDRRCFEGSTVKFVLDGKLPVGACHHQKMIVIDDAIAFCGGGDIGPDRWDTPRHLDDDLRRERTARGGGYYDSRHEAMALVDGPPAAALGALFRERWLRATGEPLAKPPEVAPAAWPDDLAPDFTDIEVGIARTNPDWRRYPEVREVERLTLASIAAAQRCIYLENQYFTSPVVAEALARRLEEPGGPEVVLVSTQHSPSWFDQVTMDRTRSNFIIRLEQADRHGRFRIYSPVTSLGRIIIVHAKLAIIDDDFLRIGSANMNNRSAGFDTECDLFLRASAAGDTHKASIAGLRTRLIAHWLGCPATEVDASIAVEGGVGGAIEALRASGHCRLRPIPPVRLGPLATFIAAFHLGDPVTPADSFRPWRRRSRLERDIQPPRAPASG